MQLDEHMQADPTLLPFVVFMLVQATGVYAMQLVPSTDSYPAVHSHDTPETPCVQTAFSPQLPLLTSQERNNVLVVSVVATTCEVANVRSVLDELAATLLVVGIASVCMVEVINDTTLVDVVLDVIKLVDVDVALVLVLVLLEIAIVVLVVDATHLRLIVPVPVGTVAANMLQSS